MQDPSYGIPDQLTGHVHLISSHRYPFMARMQLNQAYSCLFEAPKIVKQHAAMSWQYITAPQDGTMFLTWVAPRQNDVFPSDGYIWSGPEERMTQEFGGYTVDVFVQQAGYRPGVDATTCHSRRRYRLIHKNPNVNANPPDRNLWIVHYSQAEPHRIVPASQVTISRHQQSQLQQRHFIEQQGQLENREFMLHDRERWPVLKLTGRGIIQAVQEAGMIAAAPQHQMPGQQSAAPQMANSRLGGQHYHAAAQAAVGPSPAKRQRTSTVAPPEEPPASKYYDIEAEEEYASGDYLDTISARDVSRARFIQHHEWAEEVFSSPYATRQIQPTYLGFGLMGELAGLTEGIFETVRDAVKGLNGDDEIAVPPTGKVTAENVKQFETRVNEYLSAGQEEIKRLKEEHARRMDEMRRGKSLDKAERRLQRARWMEASDSGETVMNGLVSGKGEAAEDADKIVAEVEASVGKTIKSHETVELVERGGLKEKVSPQEAEQQDQGAQDDAMDADEAAMFSFGQTAANSSYTAAPPVQGGMPPVQQPQQQAPTQAPPSQPAAVPTNTSLDGSASKLNFDAGNMDTLDTTHFEIEGMDLDGPEFTFDTSNEPTPGGPSVATAAPSPQPAMTAGNPTTTQHLPPSQLGTASVQTASASASDANAAPSYHATPVSNSAFDEFTTHDDDDVDGNGGGNMENSAFGDAFGDV